MHESLNAALILHYVQTQDFRKEAAPFSHRWNRNRLTEQKNLKTWCCLEYSPVQCSFKCYGRKEYTLRCSQLLITKGLNELQKLWAATQQSSHMAVKQCLILHQCNLSFCLARQSRRVSCWWEILEQSYCFKQVFPPPPLSYFLACNLCKKLLRWSPERTQQHN